MALSREQCPAGLACPIFSRLGRLLGELACPRCPSERGVLFSDCSRGIFLVVEKNSNVRKVLLLNVECYSKNKSYMIYLI